MLAAAELLQAPGDEVLDLGEGVLGVGLGAQHQHARLGVQGTLALDPGLISQEARTLSGGELQRMCLARTLVTQPETLLLDEPTSALDEQPKRVFEATARDLAGQGITIIWVTHDKAQAQRIADRIYQLRDGHLTGIPAEEVSP